MGITVLAAAISVIGGVVFAFVGLTVAFQNLCTDTGPDSCEHTTSVWHYVLGNGGTAVMVFVILTAAIHASLGPLAPAVGWRRTAGLALALLPMPVAAAAAGFAIAHSSFGSGHDSFDYGLIAAILVVGLYSGAWCQILSRTVGVGHRATRRHRPSAPTNSG